MLAALVFQRAEPALWSHEQAREVVVFSQVGGIEQEEPAEDEARARGGWGGRFVRLAWRVVGARV